MWYGTEKSKQSKQDKDTDTRYIILTIKVLKKNFFLEIQIETSLEICKWGEFYESLWMDMCI
jgi:hypothetical protein